MAGRLCEPHARAAPDARAKVPGGCLVAMARFFSTVVHSGERIFDDAGVDFASLDEVTSPEGARRHGSE